MPRAAQVTIDEHIEEPTELTYSELGKDHLISSDGIEYVKVREFNEEGLYLWVELYTLDGAECTGVIISRPDEDEEVQKGDLISFTLEEGVARYKGTITL